MSSRNIGSINIIGVYADAARAGRATYQLVTDGFPSDSLEVMTSTPYPRGVFATHLRPSRIPYASLLGGAGGLVAGLAFAVGTALLYPLPTGGKPMIAWPTVGVITYEFTMLGLIVMTMLAFLFFARLPKRQPRHYLPSVSDGAVEVVVPCRTEERAIAAEHTLKETGAVQVLRRDAAVGRWEEI